MSAWLADSDSISDAEEERSNCIGRDALAAALLCKARTSPMQLDSLIGNAFWVLLVRGKTFC